MATLITTGIFLEAKVLPHLIVASCDPHFTVVSKAEDALKRLAKPDMEDTKMIEKLYALFNGTPANSNIPADQKRKQVSLKCV